MFVYVLNDAGKTSGFALGRLGVLDSRLLFGGYAVGSGLVSGLRLCVCILVILVLWLNQVF